MIAKFKTLAVAMFFYNDRLKSIFYYMFCIRKKKNSKLYLIKGVIEKNIQSPFQLYFSYIVVK